MLFLPLAFLVIPTTANITSAESRILGDSDPMLELASQRNIEVTNSTGSNPQTSPQSQTNNREASPNQPVEAAPTRSGNYLLIPGKVSASVVGVGLDSTGAIAVPAAAIGMYSQGGAVFLDGHSTGVFAGLSRVQIGDIAEFTLNSQTAKYQVVNIALYTYISGDNIDQLFMYDSLYSGGAAGLNMMTCAGAYLPAYGTYSHRLVVFSIRI
jgi:sortase (surface protein transpeptidase)